MTPWNAIMLGAFFLPMAASMLHGQEVRPNADEEHALRAANTEHMKGCSGLLGKALQDSADASQGSAVTAGVKDAGELVAKAVERMIMAPATEGDFQNAASKANVAMAEQIRDSKTFADARLCIRMTSLMSDAISDRYEYWYDRDDHTKDVIDESHKTLLSCLAEYRQGLAGNEHPDAGCAKNQQRLVVALKRENVFKGGGFIRVGKQAAVPEKADQ